MRKVISYLGLSALAFAFFATGYQWEFVREHSRFKNLVETSQAAERDYRALMFAFDIRMETVQELMGLAQQNQIRISENLVATFQQLAQKPDLKDGGQVRAYEAKQKLLNEATKDLIALLDSELRGEQDEFQHLYRQFLSEEESLDRLSRSYSQQTARVRRLARKGDRKILEQGLSLPASVVESL